MYDEEVETADEDVAEEAEMTFNELETMLLPKYTSAIALGIKVLEQTTLGRDEFDFESKPPPNEYNSLPLPHVVGTREFAEDDFCGLFIPAEEGTTTDASFCPSCFLSLFLVCVWKSSAFVLFLLSVSP